MQYAEEERSNKWSSLSELIDYNYMYGNEWLILDASCVGNEKNQVLQT